MFEAIVEGYQSVEPLKIGELWALPSLLRFVLIENLRRIAVRVDRSREMRHHRQHACRPDRRRGRRRRRRPAPGAATPRMRSTPPSPRSSCTACATARATPGARWSGWRTSSSATAPTPRRSSSPSTRRCRPATSPPANIVRGLRLINDVDWTVVVREGQQGRRAAARGGALRRSRFPLARPVPRRDRGAGARLRRSPNSPSPSSAIEHGEGGGCGRPRYVGHRLLPGRRPPRRAGGGDRLPRAALTRLLRAYRKAGLGRHRRAGCSPSRPCCWPMIGCGARQYRHLRRLRSRSCWCCWSLPAMRGRPQPVQQAGAAVAEADAAGRLRIQGRRAGRARARSSWCPR